MTPVRNWFRQLLPGDPADISRETQYIASIDILHLQKILEWLTLWVVGIAHLGVLWTDKTRLSQVTPRQRHHIQTSYWDIATVVSLVAFSSFSALLGVGTSRGVNQCLHKAKVAHANFHMHCSPTAWGIRAQEEF